MALYYVTGVPGAGKSTIQHELSRRGYTAFDLDDRRFGGPCNKETGEAATMPPIDQRTPEWFDAHEWRISRSAIETLRQDSINKVVYLCGIATTDNLVWDLFDKIIYLKIDESTLRGRIATRDDNDFGKTEHELERILVRYHEAEATIEGRGAIAIDANGSLDDVITKIIAKTER